MKDDRADEIGLFETNRRIGPDEDFITRFAILFHRCDESSDNLLKGEGTYMWVIESFIHSSLSVLV
jgi:hypothetical protein